MDLTEAKHSAPLMQRIWETKWMRETDRRQERCLRVLKGKGSSEFGIRLIPIYCGANHLVSSFPMLHMADVLNLFEDRALENAEFPRLPVG
jgi:hypothetical protein